MMTSLLPSILVPLIGLVFPAVAMASLFLYIEQDQIS
jgi:photosystem I subunit 8